MKSIWTKHLRTQDEKEALAKSIQGSVKTLDTLKLILASKKIAPKRSDYDIPSWPYLRADLDGYNRALDDIMSIIDITKTEK